MPVPTLKQLHEMQAEIASLKRDAERAELIAANMRKCGGHKNLFAWYSSRTSSYDSRDYDGVTRLLLEAIEEFGPTILEIVARRQDLLAHEAQTKSVLKRAELGSFVTLESESPT